MIETPQAFNLPTLWWCSLVPPADDDTAIRRHSGVAPRSEEPDSHELTRKQPRPWWSWGGGVTGCLLWALAGGRRAHGEIVMMQGANIELKVTQRTLRNACSEVQESSYHMDRHECQGSTSFLFESKVQQAHGVGKREKGQGGNGRSLVFHQIQEVLTVLLRLKPKPIVGGASGLGGNP